MLRINRRQQDAAARAVLAGAGVAMCDKNWPELED